MSFSVDETLLPWEVNSSTSFREIPSSVEMSPVWLKHMYWVLCVLTWRPMPAVARSKLCSRVGWVKMKRSFFLETVVSILLDGSTTWTLTRRLEKRDGNYTRMLRAILNQSWRQHPTKYQLYGHLPPITETIQARQTRHAGPCWRSRDELIRDVLLWTPKYGRAKAGRSGRTYIQQLCENTGCSPEDLPEAMNDWEKWRERVRDICASGTTWWRSWVSRFEL